MNDTTPRTVRIVASGSGAVGRESAEHIASEGKAVVVAYAATQMTTRSG
jgi:glutamate dehydrogenase/leucine dehydrogenase